MWLMLYSHLWFSGTVSLVVLNDAHRSNVLLLNDCTESIEQLFIFDYILLVVFRFLIPVLICLYCVTFVYIKKNWSWTLAIQVQSFPFSLPFTAPEKQTESGERVSAWASHHLCPAQPHQGATGKAQLYNGLFHTKINTCATMMHFGSLLCRNIE